MITVYFGHYSWFTWNGRGQELVLTDGTQIKADAYV